MIARTFSLLFLDVDGVLNTRIGSLDDDKLALLPQIVSEATTRSNDCLIILSSTWRKTDHQLARLTAALRARGLSLHGATPVLEKQIGTLITAAPRWQEIKHYLDRHPVENYAILDDEPHFGPLAAHHIRTDPAISLTPEHLPRILAILQGDHQRRP